MFRSLTTVTLIILLSLMLVAPVLAKPGAVESTSATAGYISEAGLKKAQTVSEIASSPQVLLTIFMLFGFLMVIVVYLAGGIIMSVTLLGK